MKKLGILLLLALTFAHTDLLAQGCAMCKTTAENLDEQAAKGLNNGILYLMSIPYLFVGIAGYLWYKKRRAADLAEDEN